MTQGERIKEVRKSLDLTLEKFGDKIGLKKNSLSQLENGVNSVTEQVTKSICREFQVDYIWLTTGEGEMFVSYEDSEIMELVDRILSEENEFTRALFKTFAKLDSKDLEALERILDMYIEQKGTAN